MCMYVFMVFGVLEKIIAKYQAVFTQVMVWYMQFKQKLVSLNGFQNRRSLFPFSYNTCQPSYNQNLKQ